MYHQIQNTKSDHRYKNVVKTHMSQKIDWSLSIRRRHLSCNWYAMTHSRVEKCHYGIWKSIIIDLHRLSSINIDDFESLSWAQIHQIQLQETDKRAVIAGQPNLERLRGARVERADFRRPVADRRIGLS